MNKSLKSLAILALLGIGGSAFGYRWGFTNYTRKTLVIQLTLAGTDANFFNIVQPGRRTEFDWGWGNARAGFCLSSIYIGPYKWRASTENFPGANSGKLPIKDPKDPKSGYDQKKIDQALDARGPWFHALSKQPISEPTVIFLKDKAWGDFDKKIKKAAMKLTGSIVRVGEKVAGMAASAMSGGATDVAGAASSVLTKLDATGNVKGDDKLDLDKMLADDAGDLAVADATEAEVEKITQDAIPKQKLASSEESMADDAAGFIGSMIELVKTGKCLSRNFDIVEFDGEIHLLTKL